MLDQICPKRVFPIKSRKSEHHYGILDIRISLGTKLQLKLNILTFWTKFAQKGYFRSKTKSEHHYWILHVRIRLGATFLGAMALRGQTGEFSVGMWENADQKNSEYGHFSHSDRNSDVMDHYLLNSFAFVDNVNILQSFLIPLYVGGERG